jgi:hypothetical protein
MDYIDSDNVCLRNCLMSAVHPTRAINFSRLGVALVECSILAQN